MYCAISTSLISVLTSKNIDVVIFVLLWLFKAFGKNYKKTSLIKNTAGMISDRFSVSDSSIPSLALIKDLSVFLEIS